MTFFLEVLPEGKALVRIITNKSPYNVPTEIPVMIESAIVYTDIGYLVFCYDIFFIPL